MTLILNRFEKKLKTSTELLALYTQRLSEITVMFFDQVGEDEDQNEEMFESFNTAWKKTARDVNETQKHTHIDPFAFEKEIEKYKQIALQNAIKSQENGSEQTAETDQQAESFLR